MEYPRVILTNTENISRLIAEHPDWPIVVNAGLNANDGGYEWRHCIQIDGRPGIVLTVQTPYDVEYVFDDKDDFRAHVAEMERKKASTDENDAVPDDFDKKVDEICARYEPYWCNVITIWVDN